MVGRIDISPSPKIKISFDKPELDYFGGGFPQKNQNTSILTQNENNFESKKLSHRGLFITLKRKCFMSELNPVDKPFMPIGNNGFGIQPLGPTPLGNGEMYDSFNVNNQGDLYNGHTTLRILGGN